MRYVTLKPRYMLRGWRDMKQALYDWEEWGGFPRKALPLTATQREAIELLTSPGVAMDDPFLPRPLRQAAQKLLALGFLEEREKDAGLADYQKYRYADTNRADVLTWSITGRCNLRCRHCYIDGGAGSYGEPTLTECREIVRQMKDANLYMVALTGGEPLARRDFWDFLDLLVEEHIHVEEIFSNGLLITDSFLDRLETRNLKMNAFLLSFDGVGWHDWMRGLKGAEERTIEAIRRLRRRGYGVIVTTVLHEESLDALPATYELMKELGVTFWRVADVLNRGNWRRDVNREVDIRHLLDAYLSLIRRMKADGMPIRHVRLAGCFEIEDGEYKFPPLSGCGTAEMENEPLCEASRLFPHLLPDGRLLPCMPMCGTAMEENAPNILTGGYDISRALTDSPLGEYMKYTCADVFRHEPECAACEHKYRCTRCPAASLPYGSVFAPPRELCTFVKGRYDERIREIMEGTA